MAGKNPGGLVRVGGGLALDGQNLMVSWVGGKLVTASNKGQLKNLGATAMDTAGVASKFAGRGDIKNAFVYAMKDLSKAVGRLTNAQKEKIFGNGKRWMNLEVMYPRSVNVIDYDKAQIVFHGTLEYNKSGVATGQPKGSARMLAGMIKQVTAYVTGAINGDQTVVTTYQYADSANPTQFTKISQAIGVKA